MRNIIKTEFLKLKRYSVIKAGIIMATLSPLLSLFYSTANGGQTWTFDYFMQQVMISNCTLFFPIIIALIAGYIITREYTDDTMKNKMCIRDRQLGELPHSTCLSYRTGSLRECLLAAFDSNKKIVLVKKDEACLLYTSRCV